MRASSYSLHRIPGYRHHTRGRSVHEGAAALGTIKQRRTLVENEAARGAYDESRLATAVDAGGRGAVVAAADRLVADPRTGRQRLGRTRRGEHVAGRVGE